MRWEYRVIVTDLVDGSEGERTLNEFGNDGWELVLETDHRLDRKRILKRWIFKRLAKPTIDRSKLHFNREEERVSDSTQAFIDKL